MSLIVKHFGETFFNYATYDSLSFFYEYLLIEKIHQMATHNRLAHFSIFYLYISIFDKHFVDKPLSQRNRFCRQTFISLKNVQHQIT